LARRQAVTADLLREYGVSTLTGPVEQVQERLQRRRGPLIFGHVCM
jgi:hypothetical protein